MAVFSMLRHPDMAFATEEDIIKASFEMDAVFDTDLSIEEIDSDGTKKLVSIAELKGRVAERDRIEAEVANETDGLSEPPKPVTEGEEAEARAA